MVRGALSASGEVLSEENWKRPPASPLESELFHPEQERRQGWGSLVKAVEGPVEMPLWTTCFFLRRYGAFTREGKVGHSHPREWGSALLGP